MTELQQDDLCGDLLGDPLKDFDIASQSPLKLDPGGVYVIEYPHQLSDRAREVLTQYLERAGERFNIKLMLLEDGAKIARMEPAAKVSQSHGAPAEFPVSPA